jgi:hypothetical protein
MAGCRHDHVRMRREGLGGEFLARRRMAHDRQVDRMIGEALQELITVAHGEAHAHARMAITESREEPREEVVARVDHRHVEEPALERLQSRDRLLGVANVREDLARAGEHLFAGLAQPESTARALEKGRAGVAFQLPDLDRDRGRREVQLLGRAGSDRWRAALSKTRSCRRVAFFIK